MNGTDLEKLGFLFSVSRHQYVQSVDVGSACLPNFGVSPKCPPRMGDTLFSNLSQAIDMGLATEARLTEARMKRQEANSDPYLEGSCSVVRLLGAEGPGRYRHTLRLYCHRYLGTWRGTRHASMQITANLDTGDFEHVDLLPCQAVRRSFQVQFEVGRFDPANSTEFHRPLDLCEWCSDASKLVTTMFK